MSEAKEIYRGRIVNLRLEPVTLPNGAHVNLEMMSHPGASAIVALDDDGVILIRQYRHAAGGFLWEVPAGTLDAGEEPETCARRELEEEAGVRAVQMTKLGAILTTPGFCDEVIHIYLAQELSEVPAHRDADEVITEIQKFPLENALEMIASGEIRDAKSAYALFRAAQHLRAFAGLNRAGRAE